MPLPLRLKLKVMVSPARTVPGPVRVAEAEAAETEIGSISARHKTNIVNIDELFFIILTPFLIAKLCLYQGCAP